MRVVNSTEPPPEFRKPDFSLSHLLEHGQKMVQEQQRVREMRLAEEYNQSWTRNRALGEITHIQPEPPAPAVNRDQDVDHNGHSPTAVESKVEPELAHQALINSMGQSDRIGLEYADERHFRINSWQCHATVDRNQAIAALESCLRDHPQDYVRIVGITNRRRLVEKIIQRPHKT
jgi:ribulose bisphosphate carboxylase small subunit